MVFLFPLRLSIVEALAVQLKTRNVFFQEELKTLFPSDLETLTKIWREEEYVYYFFILVTTGMRRGEDRALKRKHVIEDKKRTRFHKALEKAEIKTEGRNLVIHSFRHTYITLRRNILPLEILQETTGHNSESMTERYNHPSLKDSYSCF